MRVIQFPPIYRQHLPVTALHFSPDGRHLVALERGESWFLCPRRWDLHANAVIEEGVGVGCEEDAGFAPEVAFSPDERYLAYVYIERGPEMSLRLVDRAVKATARHRERRLTAWDGYRSFQDYLWLQFTPDGRTLVAAVSNSGDDDEENASQVPAAGIYTWDLSRVTKKRGQVWDGHLLADKHVLPLEEPDEPMCDTLARSLAFAPDGSMLAVGLRRDRITCLAFPSGEERPAPTVRKRHSRGVWGLAYSANGRTLAVADETVTLCDAATGAIRVTLPAGPAVPLAHSRKSRPCVHDLAFSPDGRVLATLHGDGVVQTWDTASGTARQSFDWQVGTLTAVAFSPDGCLCAVAGKEGQVAVWDVAEL
jgi:WD40 repeat protein